MTSHQRRSSATARQVLRRSFFVVCFHMQTGTISREKEWAPANKALVGTTTRCKMHQSAGRNSIASSKHTEHQHFASIPTRIYRLRRNHKPEGNSAIFHVNKTSNNAKIYLIKTCNATCSPYALKPPCACVLHLL